MGSTNPAPDPWAILERLTTAMEGLRAQTPASDAGRIEGLINTLAPALARLAEAQVEGSRLIADETRRAHRPSNEITHNRSVFNRRGTLLPDDADGPRKPPLKCVMLLPWIAEWESLTREEVELLNLLQSGVYIIKRTDDSKVKLHVTLDFNVDGVTPSRLVMTHETAFNNDNFRLMPGIVNFVRQVLKQHDPETARKAAAVMSDDEEAALIEAGDLLVSV